CLTENVPALFDECGCDDTACQPSRILDSFHLEALIDAPDKPLDFGGVAMTWNTTLSLAGARAVAVHDESNRGYVLTGAAPANLYAIDAANDAIVGSRSMANTAGLD